MTARNPKHRPAQRSAADLVEDLERAHGAATPGEVLMLCAFARADARTKEAQKVLIGKLGRELAAARKARR